LMNDETISNTENSELVINQHQTHDQSSNESSDDDVNAVEEKLNEEDIKNEPMTASSSTINFVAVSSPDHHNNISTPLTNNMQATTISSLSFSSSHSPHHYCSSSSSPSSTCSSSPIINAIKPISYSLLNSNQNNLTCNDITIPTLTTTETSINDDENENSSLLLKPSTSPLTSTFNRHEAYCHLCRKEFCNKYFLKTHFAKKHGVLDMTSTVLVGPGVMSHFKYSTNKSITNRNHPTPTSPSSSSSPSPTTNGTGTLTIPLDSTNDKIHVNKSEDNTNNAMKISKETKTTPLSTPTKQDYSADTLIEDYCELCQKRFCNKYYLRKHRAEVHGVYTDYIKSLQKSGESPLKSSRSSVSVSTTSQNNNTLSIQTTTTTTATTTTPSTSSQGVTPSNMILMNPYLLHPSQFFLSPNMFSDLKIPQPIFASSNNTAAMFQTTPSSSNGQQQYSTKNDNDNSKIKIENNEYDESEKHDGQTLCKDMNELDLKKLNEQQKPKEEHDVDESVEQKIKTETIDKLNHRRELLSCELCDQQFKNKQLLRAHVNTHHLSPLKNGRNNNNKQIHSSNSNNLDRLAFLSPYVDTTSVLAHKLEHTIPYGIMADSYFCAKMADRVVCEICNKQVCNKYFLKTHKAKVHGITNDMTPTMVNMNSLQQKTISTTADDITTTSNDDNESSRGTKEEETNSTGTDNESFSMSSLMLTAEDRDDLIKASIDPEAYCIICKKEFCSKYFLRTHHQNIHGLPTTSSSSTNTPTTTTAISSIATLQTNGSKRNKKDTKHSGISPSIPNTKTISDSKISVPSTPISTDTYQTLLQFMQAAAAFTENPSQNPCLIMSALSRANQFSDSLSIDCKKHLLISKNGQINGNQSNDEEEDEADGNHTCKRKNSDSHQEHHQKTIKRKTANDHEEEIFDDTKKRKTNLNDEEELKLSKLNIDTSQMNLMNETSPINGGSDGGGLQPFLLESDDPKFIHTFVPCMVFLPVKSRVTKQVHLNLRLKPVLTNDESN
ncbi:unnamed protein product, partial [Didymodactylos carnosus]